MNNYILLFIICVISIILILFIIFKKNNETSDEELPEAEAEEVQAEQFEDIISPNIPNFYPKGAALKGSYTNKLIYDKPIDYFATYFKLVNLPFIYTEIEKRLTQLTTNGDITASIINKNPTNEDTTTSFKVTSNTTGKEFFEKTFQNSIPKNDLKPNLTTDFIRQIIKPLSLIYLCNETNNTYNKLYTFGTYLNYVSFFATYFNRQAKNFSWDFQITSDYLDNDKPMYIYYTYNTNKTVNEFESSPSNKIDKTFDELQNSDTFREYINMFSSSKFCIESKGESRICGLNSDNILYQDLLNLSSNYINDTYYRNLHEFIIKELPTQEYKNDVTAYKGTVTDDTGDVVVKNLRKSGNILSTFISDYIHFFIIKLLFDKTQIESNINLIEMLKNYNDTNNNGDSNSIGTKLYTILDALAKYTLIVPV